MPRAGAAIAMSATGFLVRLTLFSEGFPFVAADVGESTLLAYTGGLIVVSAGAPSIPGLGLGFRAYDSLSAECRRGCIAGSRAA